MTHLLALAFVLTSNSAFAWETSKTIDKMTDEKLVMITHQSKEKVWSGRKASLSILMNCTSGVQKLMLHHPFVVKQAPVQIRLDKDKPFPLYAKPSNDKTVLLVGDSTSEEKNPKVIIQDMVKHKNILINYEDATGKIYQAEFSLNGLEKKYGKACN